MDYADSSGAVTKRLRFGNIVLCNPYSHPPVLARMAATFDAIIGGRLGFNIEAGRKEDEYVAYGIEYPI